VAAFERAAVTPGRIVIDGASLTCSQVTAVARGTARVTVADAALDAARGAWRVAGEVAARHPFYGRNTGVGANRVVGIDETEDAGHGLRLLRSHAAGAGPLLGQELARAMLVVRLNQLGAGGSGVDPALLPVLADAINRGFTPPVPLYGAIGTGDLTALASTGLCLLGERSWRPPTAPPPAVPSPAGPSPAGLSDAGPPQFELQSADALAFMSSNAATLGESALACCDLAELLRSTVVITALSLAAVRASLEPYAEKVQAACPHPGQQWTAASVRGLMEGAQVTADRVQDPYGFRAFPQVHGPVVDAAGYADTVVARELNAAGENPLVDVEGQRVWHNGNFHAAYVGLALDTTRAALFQTAALSGARLGMLVEPSFTGLNAFQADTVTSSGIMILEYVAQSAVADIRRFAMPAALGNAVLSRGVEEHAGFSTQSAHATLDAVGAYRVVLACELVAAVRALRMQGRVPAGRTLRAAYDMADAVLDPRMTDRPLDEDVAAATGILGSYATLCP
jgi:histidine ammonia-lyase